MERAADTDRDRSDALYFAYGSNMSSRRLGTRLGAVEWLDRGRLPRHRLTFHKAGRDGSGKCDAWRSGDAEDCVIGIVYRLTPQQATLLHRFEGAGRGYDIHEVDIALSRGGQVRCFTYRATHIDAACQPFCWYREHVLRGAIEHDLPPAYIAAIRAVSFVDDNDTNRRRHELQIYD